MNRSIDRPGLRGRLRGSARCLLSGLLLASSMATAGDAAPASTDPHEAPPRRLLWGDTHLHTSYSFDAFLNGNQSADPDQAYRWAKGLPVIHPYHRARVRIGTPLDFLVVSDHAEFLGGIRDIHRDGIQDPDPGPIEQLFYWYNEWRIRRAIDAGEGQAHFADLLPVSGDPRAAAAQWADGVAASVPGAERSLHNAWQRLTETADRHHDPGNFTALIGWEWSSTPGGANLHRVVVTDADGATARRFLPFSSGDSPYPEDLWAWLERTAGETGARFLAIPHNSNLSKGLMFDERSLRGDPIDADHARRRMEFERMVEVTQIKGDSETHPRFSPEDPFADFEPYTGYLQQQEEPYRAGRGDFVRSALRTGLELEARTGANPFRFGMLGSTDAHTGLSSAEEPNFWGKMAVDSIPENKAGNAMLGVSGWRMSASGLAAVWAERNDRGAIVEALQRREAYATTGPRIRVRVFAAQGLDETALERSAGELRRQAVPMGAVLAADGSDRPPALVIRAARDPAAASLDRIQVVKGWVDAAGDSHERVFDAVWAGDRVPDAEGRVPQLASSVDLADGSHDDSTGVAELATVWRDPQFDPEQAAFYYVRVLQIPTARHSLFDAIALRMDAPDTGPAVIRERAYTSPIWYRP